MTREVHPVADLFPMLAEDELRELAADIQQRGLLYPIVRDKDGRVLDGRNRLAACEIAGVEPTFVTYEGDDPDGYALAVNVQRRNLSKGQIAMVAVQASRLFATNNQDTVARGHDLSQSRVAYAVVVHEHAPDLVGEVIAGDRSLDEAYRTATANKDRKKRLAKLDRELATLVEADVLDLGEAEQRARDNERMAKLPPDLIERVNGGLSIDEAEDVVQKRAERIKVWTEKIRAGLDTFTRMAGNPIPAELKESLTDQELTNLSTVLGVLEPEGDSDGLMG